jgi:uncharacterized protein (TIGR02231 family)
MAGAHINRVLLVDDWPQANQGSSAVNQNDFDTFPPNLRRDPVLNPPMSMMMFLITGFGIWRNVMKYFGLYLLASTAMAQCAWAEDYRPLSNIDAVTVFPTGADVTRFAEVQMSAGDHQLILENLPGDIDAQSIRVAGEGGKGIEIVSVDSKAIALKSGQIDQQRKQLEKTIEDLQDERAALEQTITDADTQRQFLAGLVNRQITPASATDTAKAVDPAALGGLLDVMGTRLASLAKVTQEARLRQKAIDVRSDEIRVEIAALAPEGEYRTQVIVHLASADTVKGVFKVSYRIGNAGWQPYYDAKLAVPKDGAAAMMELVRRAEVVQSTTENWDGVALTLSTARPAGASTAPDIFEQELVVADDRQRNAGSVSKIELSRKVDSNSLMTEGEADLPEAPAPVADDKFKIAQRQAFIETVGFQANYVIQGRVNVDNSGTSKRVRISSDNVNVKLSVTSVPRLDANAYLTTEFVAKGDGPMLPGVVNLYRDGVYVGQGALPLLSAGEDAKLGFGVDDLVKVTRKEIKRRTGEEGLLTSSNVEERSWATTVKNLHAFAVPVTVMDRLPFVTLDGVEVTMMPDTTEPDEKDVEKKRGVMAWKLAVAPMAENTIKFGYKVTSPKALQVGMVD